MRHDRDAVSDPFSVYPTPQAVLEDEHLPTAAKLHVLQAMEQDLVALQNAEGENMPGDEQRPGRIADVRSAILSLDPAAEAHGEVERARHLSGDEHSATLTTEQARQGELAFKTRRQRKYFAVYLAVAIALLAIVLYVARPWA